MTPFSSTSHRDVTEASVLLNDDFPSASYDVFYLVVLILFSGCQAGAACRFLHPEPAIATTTAEPPSAQSVEPRNYQAPPVPQSQVSRKPVSALQASNPREHQLQQLRRRFAPQESLTAEATTLTFSLVPSDPDFPFDLAALQCTLTVPKEYPLQDGAAVPTLRISNKDMERGFQANIERGFNELFRAKSADQTLLNMMNALDRRLESLLSGRKAETVKLVANAAPPTAQSPEAIGPTLEFKPISVVKSELPAPQRVPEVSYGPEQRDAAAARREAETRQLEARLGRQPRFAKSVDGIAYTVPVTPAHRADLPVPLQAVVTAEMFVPRLYPLLNCRIKLHGVARDAARATERAFERHAVDVPQMSLMGHLNYMAVNMHVLAEQGAAEQEDDDQDEDLRSNLGAIDIDDDDTPSDVETSAYDGKSHIHVIPRPPEWGHGPPGTTASDSDNESTDDHSESDSQVDDGGQEANASSGSSTIERGIAISFPGVELHGIELLELASLSLTVKCERCKDTMDVPNLRPAANGATRSESCKKCASALQLGILSRGSGTVHAGANGRYVAYRRELIHANSIRAGYLDLEGCTVVDMLPRYSALDPICLGRDCARPIQMRRPDRSFDDSLFIPTCGECSTAFPTPGCVAVRGDSVTASCRDCHRKMSS